MKLKFPVQFKISDFKNGWEFKLNFGEGSQ